MAQQPKVMGVLIEPPPPTWWKANRHKVLAVAGLVLGYLIATHLQGAPDQQTRPHPGHSTPAPTTPHATRTVHIPT
ncbi:hypothetical protein [Streptomyces longhuiensis]|uniref:hypothetical protein n=1 Tax=Streptomyces longhuiensis TaxID=2880933 RepID=UPI001D0AF1FD|nr:hypothetical protein [Streptomyces longhuiensis]UDM05571.1 hypothetical protein LGI35_45845 [Streptomyces longhuiensis]